MASPRDGRGIDPNELTPARGADQAAPEDQEQSEGAPPKTGGDQAGSATPATSVRGILRHSTIYGIGPVLQRLLALVLVRLYTSRLTPGEFGVLDLVDLLLILLPQLVGVNLLSGLTRFYFEHTDPRRRALVVSSTTIALTAVGLAGTALALVFRRPLAALLFATPEGGPAPDGLVEAVTLGILIVPFSLGKTSGMRYLEVLKKSRTYALVDVLKTVLESGLKLWMLFGLEWGVRGFLVSVLIGEGLACLGFAVWMALRLRTGFAWATFRPILAFAAPLLPIGIVQLGLHYFGRLLLEHLGPSTRILDGAADLETTLARTWVGVFGLGYKIAFLAHSTVIGPFMQIWQPHVFGLPEQQRRVELVRLGNWAIVTLTALYLPVAIFGRQGVDLLAGAEGYRAAWRVTPIVLVAYLAFASYGISHVALMAIKRTWPLLWLNIGALILGCVSGALLVPLSEQHGYALAAVACLAAFVPMAVLAEVLVRAQGWRTRSARGALVPPLAAILTLLATLAVDYWRDPLEPGALVPVLAAKIVILLALLAGLWTFGLDPEGRAGIRRLVADGLAYLRRRPGGTS